MEKIIEAIYELRNISNRQGENAPSEVVKKMILKLGKYSHPYKETNKIKRKYSFILDTGI